MFFKKLYIANNLKYFRDRELFPSKQVLVALVFFIILYFPNKKNFLYVLYKKNHQKNLPAAADQDFF